jgi:hypothetical protein
MEISTKLRQIMAKYRETKKYGNAQEAVSKAAIG